MTDVLVQADAVNFSRAGRDIVAGVSLQVRRGESVALTGPSGSGKSALLTLLAGLERPDSGRLQLAVAPSQVGLVLQGYGLVGLLTVEENVAMPLLTLGRAPLSPDEVQERVRHTLEVVGLASFANTLVEILSGGQQQRVAVARALVTRPALLVADEPSAALDATTRDQVIGAILSLHDTGTTVIIATHDHTVAARLDRRIELEDGHATEVD